MPTIAEVADRIVTLKNSLTVIQSEITNVLTTAGSTSVTTSETQRLTQDLARLQDEEVTADRQFTEQAALMDAMGGKTREQTLQEFVLLFFYIGLSLFVLSITFVAYLNQGGSAAGKMFGGLLVAMLIITALILRLA